MQSIDKNVTRCSERCPTMTILRIEQRHVLDDAAPSQKIGRGVHTFLCDIGAVAYAAVACASRKLDGEDPSEACVKWAQRIANKIGPLVIDEVTEREYEILQSADIAVE